MMGLSAGVVTEAEANTNFGGTPSKLSASLQNPATWSFIWAGLALLYLVVIYFGMFTVRRRGAAT